MADFGYDVADYCDIDPVFGTLRRPRRADRGLPCARDQARARLGAEPQLRPASVVRRVALEPRQPQARLVRVAATAAQRLDLGVQGRADRRGPSTRPRGQWYLHTFMAEQPDLNWDNPEVEAAMHDVLRFWMDRGVDGLRLDAIAKIAKDPLLRDHERRARRHDEDWETIHERLRGIRRVIDEYDDRMIVGEVALQDLHRVVGYLESGDQLHLAHNFVFIDQEWDAETYGDSIADFEALADETAWPAWFLATTTTRAPRAASTTTGSAAAGARDPADALHAARHAVRLPGRGARPARRAGSRPTASSTSTAATPSARRSPGRRTRRPRLHHRRPWLPFVDDAARLNAADAGRRPALDAQADARARPAARREPALHQRRADARSTPAPARSPGPGEDAVRRGQLHGPELPLAVEGTLMISSDPDRETASAPLELGPSEALLLRLAT